ncbi:polysaccharide pyruvyl transferase family protein [Nocardioides sp. T5]|uniref:polysaccharide pyruvyl transferase family protein n=1 Tax=Nocardioides sp. T5 TaxID=3400182 RepID=UPI003A8A5DC9
MNEIVVSEAYSASNLGDLELVRQSVNVVSATTDSDFYLVAVHPDSFPDLGQRLALPRIFDRLEYRKRSGAARAALIMSWGLRLAVLSFIAIVPSLSARRRLAGLFPNAAVRAYARSRRVVAVGGGYIGDQYRAETLLVAWTWWWSCRVVGQVETMPISYEIDNPRLGRVFARLAKNVTMSARDSASHRRMATHGLEARLIPDLAFLNARPSAGSVSGGHEPDRYFVSLVGRDYLDPRQLDRVVDNVVATLERAGASSVGLVAMHAPLGNSGIGADWEALDVLAARLRSADIGSSRVVVDSYGELIDVLAGGRALIAARMHAGIAGLCAGLPVMLLAYEDKHFAMARDRGLEQHCIDIRSERELFVNCFGRTMATDASVFANSASEAKRHVQRAFGPGAARA